MNDFFGLFMVIFGISEKRRQIQAVPGREEDKQEGTFRVREKISPEHNQDETLGEHMMETDQPSVW
jgi:hypothetical protein